MDPPKPPFLLKLPGPSLAHDGIVLVLDPRSAKAHYVCCHSCAAGKSMSMSTFVQKHQVHSGKNCAPGYDSLPVGSMVLPLGEIQGWRTLKAGDQCHGKSTAASLTGGNIGVTDSKSNEEGVETKLDRVHLGSDSEKELHSGSEQTGRNLLEDSDAGVQQDDIGVSLISDAELERKLSTLSRRQLAWRAGVGKYGGMTHAELVALVSSRFRTSPFPLPGDDV